LQVAADRCATRNPAATNNHVRQGPRGRRAAPYPLPPRPGSIAGPLSALYDPPPPGYGSWKISGLLPSFADGRLGGVDEDCRTVGRRWPLHGRGAGAHGQRPRSKGAVDDRSHIAGAAPRPGLSVCGRGRGAAPASAWACKSVRARKPTNIRQGGTARSTRHLDTEDAASTRATTTVHRPPGQGPVPSPAELHHMSPATSCGACGRGRPST
jgi:hypothetical protein